MSKQHFADIGTDFDMNDIAGPMCWYTFLEYVKDPAHKARVMRVRFLGDYCGGGHRTGYIFDLSYVYVEVDGKVYDCKNFPVYNLCGVGRNAPQKAMYQMAKESGVFIPGLFDGLSVFV